MGNQYVSFELNDFKYKSKVAAFDYDHTLVKPKKGTFSHSVEDWLWLRENVPTILNQFNSNGYAIVVFTNQSKPFKVEQIKLALGELNLPLKVYSGISNEARKPNTFMWDMFDNSSDVKIDKTQSFFVGDALGRVGDWSDSDKIFGEAIGLALKTPEEIFPFETKSVSSFEPSKTQELILMVGYPGSGKSTFVKQQIPDNYVKLSGDLLKTPSKTKKAVKQGLDEGKSVVLDATNSSVKKRALFIEIAKDRNVPVRAIHITTCFEQSKYQNSLRDNKVPMMALYIYRKHFEEPTNEEGLVEIYKPFI
tara:strand:+ start:343 stop:1263 length:921 start_codon:yes stop_codon:yes gene_type:complete